MMNFALIRLPNKAYFLWENNSSISAQSLLFALQGIKSSGKTVIMPSSLGNHCGWGSIARYLSEKGFNQVDRIFICDEGDIRYGSRERTNSEMGICFREITKKVLFYNVDRWIRENGITRAQLDWFTRVVRSMIEDKQFLLGQMNDRLELERLKKNIIETQTKIEKREEDLKNLRSVEEVGKTSIKNIKNMKWIDKIESAGNEGLRILTKPMACTYVPNISRYLDVEDIKRHDILYRIAKYQFLGKYFIIQPDYYIVDSNFGIKADSNERYPQRTRIRNVMIKNTYFHGQACHIGDRQACVGELGAAISNARKNGLDMLLMSFEAYLRSINLPDAAGQRYYCLPMGDADGNVEVWPYVEDMMKKHNISFGDKPRNLETYEWILGNTRLKEYHEQFGCPFEHGCRDYGDAQGDRKLKECLELIKEREPKVYDYIMARVEKGAVL